MRNLSIALFAVVLAGCGPKTEEDAPASPPAAASTATTAPVSEGATAPAATTTPTGDASNGGMQSVKPGEAGSR